jgi:hypothetical protein
MWNEDGGYYSIFSCPTTETKYMTNKRARWRVLRNRTRQPTVETVRGSGAKIYVFYLQCR